jgi:biopolymer transport protein ExbD/biopolymer transport protein TolR
MAFTNSKGRTQTSLSDINITPFVDVVLVLLIIFMLTAPVLESGMVMESHKTKTVKTVQQDKIVITIDKDRNYYVGNDMVNIHLLGETVVKRLNGSTNQPVYIRCVENVKFGTFVQVVDALKQANVTNLVIVTEPLDTSGSS